MRVGKGTQVKGLDTEHHYNYVDPRKEQETETLNIVKTMLCFCRKLEPQPILSNHAV